VTSGCITNVFTTMLTEKWSGSVAEYPMELLPGQVTWRHIDLKVNVFPILVNHATTGHASRKDKRESYRKLVAVFSELAVRSIVTHANSQGPFPSGTIEPHERLQVR
jgi:hypothetical protein